MSTTLEYDFGKLKGSENYKVWSIRAQAALQKEEGKWKEITATTATTDSSNIEALATLRLIIEDGPLLQTRTLSTAKEVWHALENLYAPKGFTSEYLTCKALFETTLVGSLSMEDYLNTTKRLSDQLQAKNLEIPKQVIIAWVLNNVTEDDESLVTNLTQGSQSVNETLFANLLDESKRLAAKEHAEVLFTKGGKHNKSNKINKEKRFCTHCKLTSLNTEACYFKHPERAPKSWQNKAKALEKELEKHEKTPREIREHNENVLFSTAPHTLGPVQPELPEIDFNLDLESIVNLDEFEVYITIQNAKNPITNKTITDVDRSNLLVENQLDPLYSIRVIQHTTTYYAPWTQYINTVLTFY